MPPSLATILCAVFVLVLLRRDVKAHRSISGAIWIPIIWAFIISSRPVSDWLEGGAIVDISQGPQDDTLLDKTLYLVLIAAGFVVLAQRRINWGAMFQRNKWVFLYFL